MQPSKQPYKPGHWVSLGFMLGTFIGIVFDKLALGMIFGFFVGAAIDSSKRKAASESQEAPTEDER